MERKGIVAAGNWIVDHVKIIDEYPPQDALANILSQSSANGGSPYNILKDLVKLKASFPLFGMGLVGDDANGTYILKECQTLGIDVSCLQKTQLQSTSYTDVMTVKATGRRTFFHHRGANALFGREHCSFAHLHGKIFHLGYLLLLDELDKIDSLGRTQASYLLETAIQQGYLTSVDLVSESSNRFQTVIPPSLPFVDYLFANEYEASKTTGISIVENEEVNIQKAILATKKLLEMGVRKTVFLHFPKGALAVEKNGKITVQGSVKVPQEKIQGATGAGDAFAAGVLFGLHENWDITQVLQLGVCAAATCLFDATCSDGILPYTDAIRIGQTYGFYEIN
ncbi:MAG: carbohydrate kinase family protein [Cytophagales bacterium]|nr:carbohydrate kinase family protein [Cytophagales bacterium]MDW8383404.1 carbohydrate kinase family protein [Flammeovirgaceae bacterium]